ncbi:type II secretion system F family protein [Candidatus Sumerlaeota bacterium]|nr:type II secretion system F family protein [Candidatus Sumerlaeota bacterium]
MPEFTYEALDKQGKQVKGIIEAGNEDVIIEKLRDMGYYPLKVTPHKAKASDMDLLALPGLRFVFHRIKTRHVMTFTRQLATLIDAGLPILRSLTILREQVESVLFKDKIIQIAKDIESGASLSDAFSKHPKVFDKLYVNMVRAGELGGVLETVLNKVAIFLEKRQMMISKVKSAMMYPVVVLLLAGCIVGFILIKIIPKFVAIFTDLGAQLPMPTQILVNASNILLHQTHWVILGIVAVIVTYVQINKTNRGKFIFDTIKLKLPVFGNLFKKSAIARFASTLSTLITAGVPILQALDITRDSSGNEVVARAMEKVYQSVKDGDTIHEPLSQCKIFPPLVYHMVAVGEETGAIDHMLTKVAEAYEREVEDMVDGLTALLEPLLIVALGILVGGIVIALYLPLFYLPGAISKND